MEVCSVLLCDGYTPWQGLLFTASLLTCWQLSTAAPTIESVPFPVVEGENVLLLVHNLPENLSAVSWSKRVKDVSLALSKDLRVPGPLHRGRRTLYHNGSLLLRSVLKKDEGFYTLRTFNMHAEIMTTTTILLNVHTYLWTCGRHAASGQPTIVLVPPRVVEGESVLLRVHNLPENILSFFWFKWITLFRKLEIAHYIIEKKSTIWGPAYSGRETLYSDGSLLLHGVTQKDPALYTLRIVRTDMKSEEAHVKLQVDTSLSVSCNPFSSSQLKIQPVRRYVAEGEGVFLDVHNLPDDRQAFTWYKSNHRTPSHKILEYTRDMNSISWGPEFRRNGVVYDNGSLMLHDVTEKDTGIYTLSVLKKDSTVEKASMEFDVKKSVTQPFVRITNTTVSRHTSVIFTCISPDTDISIRWILNNQSLPHLERMTLSPTRCGLRISPVTSEDAGAYQCEASDGFSLKTSLPVSWP
ncbi:carcinoembryonic antigen-related cell adhesion molecule 3-like [Sigmodon hispidus]